MDKIRVEIEQIEINGHIRDVECFTAGINAALNVIDKYKVYERGKNNKESIPYLMHKEMDIPISECQKAYDVAMEYLRSQAKVKG